VRGGKKDKGRRARGRGEEELTQFGEVLWNIWNPEHTEFEYVSF
jgi:hypothetical protein